MSATTSSAIAAKFTKNVLSLVKGAESRKLRNGVCIRLERRPFAKFVGVTKKGRGRRLVFHQNSVNEVKKLAGGLEVVKSSKGYVYIPGFDLADFAKVRRAILLGAKTIQISKN